MLYRASKIRVIRVIYVYITRLVHAPDLCHARTTRRPGGTYARKMVEPCNLPGKPHGVGTNSTDADASSNTSSVAEAGVAGNVFWDNA
jgi:hypothetical protein